MRRMRTRWDMVTRGCPIGLMGLAATSASAQNAVSLDDMAARLSELEQQNQTLQTRVNELEAGEEGVWLTEARATEIRGIVTDVLADAETRNSLQTSAMTAGWDDGFFLQSPDGRFRLNIGGMLQTRYMYSHINESWAQAVPVENPGVPGSPQFSNQRAWYTLTDDVVRRYGFDVPYARLDMTGHVFGPDTKFRIMGQYQNVRQDVLSGGAGNSSFGIVSQDSNVSGALVLEDAWISHELGSGFTARIGQFKLPFDLGWEVAIPNQMTGDRSTTAYHFGLGRSQGIELGYVGDSIRGRAAISDGGNDNLLGGYKLVTTSPRSSPYTFTGAEFALSGRFEWKLAGGWRDFDRSTSPPGEEFGALLGFGAHWQQGKVNLNPFDNNGTVSTGTNALGQTQDFSENNYNKWFGLTADATVNFGGAMVTASAYWHNVDSGASYVPGDFNIISGNISPPPGQAPTGNPTADVGTIEMMGLSVYGAAYVTPTVELLAGVDYMDVTGGSFAALSGLAGEPAGNPTLNSRYGAYLETKEFVSLTFGGTWYIDGEDLKLGITGTYLPTEVSPAWYTPETGIRPTPVSDQFILRAYVQLLF